MPPSFSLLTGLASFCTLRQYIFTHFSQPGIQSPSPSTMATVKAREYSKRTMTRIQRNKDSKTRSIRQPFIVFPASNHFHAR